jgi:hypothetical protein
MAMVLRTTAMSISASTDVLTVFGVYGEESILEMK